MNRVKIIILSQLLVVLILGAILSIFGVPNIGKNSVDSRVLSEQWEKVSLTGSVVYEIPEEKGKFLFEAISGHEFIGFSKNYDLENYLGKMIFIDGESHFPGFGFKNLEIKKVEIIEEIFFKEPEKFFLENKFGGYGFELDENIFTAIKGGNKTFLKNGSGETILKFFSHDFSGNGSFFSNGSNQTNLNGINGEIKSLQNGQEIFLNNLEKGYGVLIQIDYGENPEKSKKEIYDFLQTFKFVEKESISKERCGGIENLICPEGYFCELFSTDENANGRCVEIE